MGLSRDPRECGKFRTWGLRRCTAAFLTTIHPPTNSRRSIHAFICFQKHVVAWMGDGFQHPIVANIDINDFRTFEITHLGFNTSDVSLARLAHFNFLLLYLKLQIDTSSNSNPKQSSESSTTGSVLLTKVSDTIEGNLLNGSWATKAHGFEIDWRCCVYFRQARGTNMPVKCFVFLRISFRRSCTWLAI